MKIAILGLGYVGLPLAVAFAKKYEVIGFDNNIKRIEELQKGVDRTGEVDAKDLKESKITYTNQQERISPCNIYIITVPTPIDQHQKPDLEALTSVSFMITAVMKKGDVIIYESTVYPGATEEVCKPILEKSGLAYNQDFFCGYSPERINPGDKKHRLENIKKVVSASNKKTAEFIGKLYNSIIPAGVHIAPTIKVAEMAKVIENTQRDINIAFMNELAMICNRLKIPTGEVIKAARTKWNFLDFSPGLVGGHCIGVDPYYLAYKASQEGHHPEMILSGRKINEFMPGYIASQFMKLLIKKKINISVTKVLILGATFKENCPDTRNSKVFNIIKELKEFGISDIFIYDPLANPNEVKREYKVELISNLVPNAYDGVILAVAHRQFLELNVDNYTKPISVIYDVKSVLKNSDESL